MSDFDVIEFDEWHEVDSSAIVAFAYEPQTKTFGVIWDGGAEYHYLDVPPSVYELVKAAPSKGVAINMVVKRDDFRRV